MMKFKSILAGLLLFVLPLSVFAQKGESSSSFKLTKKGVVKSTVLADSTVQELNVLKPIAIFKGKYELDTENGDSYFTVKSARLGVQGDVSKKISYKFMVDFSDEGTVRVLDLYFVFKPFNRFSFTLGQSSLPLFNGYTASPNLLEFSNRPFISKYFNSSRDIGLTAAYAIKQNGFPIVLEAGIYNGDGINNPKWTSTPSLAGRLSFGSMKGFRATAKVYQTRIDATEDNFIWAADLRYANSAFTFESEFMNKKNHGEMATNTQALSSIYCQTLYKFPVKSNVFKYLQPALRWDGMGYDLLNRGLGVNRATVGVNIGLNSDAFSSLFRLNYEHYFNNSMDMSALFKNDYYNDNKFSVEFLFVF